MLYQLAKTSTLLTGQVKWDLVLNGDVVSNLQLVPISEHIPFNYDAPEDVLNYSHCDNLKKLYAKIGGDFYNAVVDPNLSTEHLHRSKNIYQDTHENTYEMGMKRMEYHRYSKQFSFFCPFWCDNINDFNNLRFKIIVKNPKHTQNIDVIEENDRVLYSSFIDMSYIKDYMTKYFEALGVYPVNASATRIFNNKYYNLLNDTTYDSSHNIQSPHHTYVNVLDSSDIVYIDDNNLVWELNTIDTHNGNIYNYLGDAVTIKRKMYENNELIYLNFTEYRAWVKGINVEKGIVQTCEASQIINNITSQERPMLEFDNMIANMFSTNHLVCSQLFNFNFIFNIEDLIPVDFIKSMQGEKLNIYIDIYCGEEKVEVRDLYSNYEFIPRYDNKLTKYTDKNALDYLNDYTDVDIIKKNKLAQSTFHWAIQSNPDLMFNMYDGMSPVYGGEERTQGIMETASDLYSRDYNTFKNPSGIFCYHYEPQISSVNVSTELERILNDDKYFYSFNFNSEDEFQWFGDMRVKNQTIIDVVNDLRRKYASVQGLDFSEIIVRSKGGHFSTQTIDILNKKTGNTDRIFGSTTGTTSIIENTGSTGTGIGNPIFGATSKISKGTTSGIQGSSSIVPVNIKNTKITGTSSSTSQGTSAATIFGSNTFNTSGLPSVGTNSGVRTLAKAVRTVNTTSLPAISNNSGSSVSTIGSVSTLKPNTTTISIPSAENISTGGLVGTGTVVVKPDIEPTLGVTGIQTPLTPTYGATSIKGASFIIGNTFSKDFEIIESVEEVIEKETDEIDNSKVVEKYDGALDISHTLISDEYIDFKDAMSKVIVQKRGVITLGGINNIKTAYIQVEPYVTYEQIHQFMESKGFYDLAINYSISDNYTIETKTFIDYDNKNLLCMYAKDPETNNYTVVFIQIGEATDEIKSKMFYQGFISLAFNGDETNSEIKLVLDSLQTILRAVDKPIVHRFTKSVATKHYNSFDITSLENRFMKCSRITYIQRYDLNLYPYFVAIDDEHKRNYTYWCKQYINTLGNVENVMDDISSFNKASFKKFSPVYPSLGYFVINKDWVDYRNFYMKKTLADLGLTYQGDISWYKANSMFLLPTVVNIEYVDTKLEEKTIQDLLFNELIVNLDLESEESIQKSARNLFIDKIYNLYKTSFTYDYASDTDINKMRYKIKYELR